MRLKLLTIFFQRALGGTTACPTTKVFSRYSAAWAASPPLPPSTYENPSPVAPSLSSTLTMMTSTAFTPEPPTGRSRGNVSSRAGCALPGQGHRAPPCRNSPKSKASLRAGSIWFD